MSDNLNDVSWAELSNIKGGQTVEFSNFGFSARAVGDEVNIVRGRDFISSFSSSSSSKGASFSSSSSSITSSI